MKHSEVIINVVSAVRNSRFWLDPVGRFSVLLALASLGWGSGLTAANVWFANQIAPSVSKAQLSFEGAAGLNDYVKAPKMFDLHNEAWLNTARTRNAGARTDTRNVFVEQETAAAALWQIVEIIFFVCFSVLGVFAIYMVFSRWRMDRIQSTAALVAAAIVHRIDTDGIDVEIAAEWRRQVNRLTPWWMILVRWRLTRLPAGTTTLIHAIFTDYESGRGSSLSEPRKERPEVSLGMLMTLLLAVGWSLSRRSI
jgi:hypothetical protein